MQPINSLPSYPCIKDVWDVLCEEKRPIVVYGMGNGADKLLSRLEILGVKVSDIFASDGFVRGHSFHGMRVKSFSEIKDTYPDFVILLSFASNRQEVIEMLSQIDKSYDMYVPDMPIAGVEEYFDRDFYNRNYDSIISAYNSFSDTRSREIFSAVINYRLSGKMQYLINAYDTVEEMFSIFPKEKIRVMVDAGAYNGDTARLAIDSFPNLEKIYAIEPDRRNFKKLLRFSESAPVDIVTVNGALFDSCNEGSIMGSANRNSTVCATPSHEHESQIVRLLSLDSLEIPSVDYIKYDVEGAEYEALVGSHNTIMSSRPVMLISLYHRSGDIFRLVSYMREKYPDYEFYLRRLYCIPAWELNLIMIPKNDF